MEQRLIIPEVVKKFPTVWGTWRFITSFTRALLLARSIQFTPRFCVLNIHLILFSHRCPDLPSHIFPSGFASLYLFYVLVSLSWAPSLHPSTSAFIGLGSICISVLSGLNSFTHLSGKLTMNGLWYAYLSIILSYPICRMGLFSMFWDFLELPK